MLHGVAKCYAQNLGTKNVIAFFPRKRQKNIFGFGTGSAFIYGIRKKESDENGKSYPY
jgi:hypothetical protein